MDAGRTLGLVLFLLPLMGVVACDDATRPGPHPGDPEPARFDGSFDPEAESFVLQRLEVATQGSEPVAVELVGSDLRVDVVHDVVRIGVAMRNVGSRTLYPPATVRVFDFVPTSVVVLDPSLIPLPESEGWIFDSAAVLGPQGMLAPGLLSQPCTWVIHDPGLVGFSFAAEARLAAEAPAAVISGGVFEDLDENGVRTRNEGPWPFGALHLRAPSGATSVATVDERGAFRFRVNEVGLYELRLESIVDCVTCITTPNPLRILLPPGPDGRPDSFGSAIFGAVCAPCGSWRGAVRLTGDDPSSIGGDPYTLRGFWLDGSMLNLEIEFGGCQPGHPDTLWAGRAFMESDPVQTWVTLSHDGLDEACEALWHQRLRFDLQPIRDAHVQDYGRPGPVLLRILDFEGEEHTLLLEP